MSIRPGAWARKMTAFLLAAACSLPALGQTPAPPQTQDQTPQAQTQATQPPPSRPIPTRTIGLDPGKIVNWTLRDAIIAGLEKNVDIEIERENVRLAQFDVESARGVYDLIGSSGISYNSNRNPNTFVFSGTTAQFNTRETFTYNFGLQQFVEKGGGSYTIDFTNTRTTTNTNLYSPEYRPNLTLQYTQPLFRNLKIDTRRRQIQISKKRLDLSDAQFRQRAIEIISQVQQAYWNLALAIRDEEIQREAAKLAETQLNNIQRQVEVGTLAPIDVVSAATQLESRRQQVFAAMNQVAQAENALKNLTVEGPNSDLWTAQIVPVEKFDIQHVTLPLQDAIKLAFENRPEMKQVQLQKEINRIDIDFFKDQMKPQIDLVGNYTMIGYAGTGTQPNLVFEGGYPTALGNLFKNDTRQWTIGVQISFPFRNRTAKANYGRALEAERQIDLQTRRMMQSIEVEVRNAVQAVETAKMRIEAARAAREYAQQQLDGETKRFAAGMSTTFLILTRQNELAQAQGVELRALGDFNIAVAQLQRAISTTLSSNNIEIRSEVTDNN